MSTTQDEKKQFEAIVSGSMNPLRRLFLSMRATWEDRAWRVKHQRRLVSFFDVMVYIAIPVGFVVALGFNNIAFAYAGFIVAASSLVLSLVTVPWEDQWAAANDEVG